MIEEKDIQKLLRKGMLFNYKNDLFYFFLSRNIFEKEFENRVRLADQSTHILFKIDFNKPEYIISRSFSESESQVDFHLNMFFQSYSRNKTFRDSIDTQTIKLIDDEPITLNLSSNSFMGEDEIFSEEMYTEQYRRQLLAKGFVHLQYPDNLFRSFFSKDKVQHLIKVSELPEYVTNIVFEMKDYRKALRCGLLLRKDNSKYIFNLRKFVRFYNDAEFQKIVTVYMLDSRPCIPRIFIKMPTPVKEVLKKADIEDSSSTREWLNNNSMVSRKVDNSFWFCVRKDLMPLPDYATHVSIMINYQKAMDLDLVKVIDAGTSEERYDLNLRKFVEAYRTLEKELDVKIMKIVHDESKIMQGDTEAGEEESKLDKSD